MFYQRIQNFSRSGNKSVFLWGARQTGKSTLLKAVFPEALGLDLLESDVHQTLLSRPQTIREIVAAHNSDTIVIDEIQKIPILLNEVHGMIENTNKRFILSGPSPRKIIRTNQNLFGGRALRYGILFF